MLKRYSNISDPTMYQAVESLLSEPLRRKRRTKSGTNEGSEMGKNG
jgi:hypothetical protein